MHILIRLQISLYLVTFNLVCLTIWHVLIGFLLIHVYKLLPVNKAIQLFVLNVIHIFRKFIIVDIYK